MTYEEAYQVTISGQIHEFSTLVQAVEHIEKHFDYYASIKLVKYKVE